MLLRLIRDLRLLRVSVDTFNACPPVPTARIAVRWPLRVAFAVDRAAKRLTEGK